MVHRRSQLRRRKVKRSRSNKRTQKIKLGLLPRRKCQFFGLRNGSRSRRSRFGSTMTSTAAPSTSAPVFIPAEYGPGYDATSQQSYPNMQAPYYGQWVPWVNPSNWWFPTGNGQVQSPEMTYH